MPWQVVSVASAPGNYLTDISQGGKPYRAQDLGLFTVRTNNKRDTYEAKYGGTRL